MSTAVQQALPAATWSVDNVHSTVTFALKYMASTFRAGFERFDATLDTTGDEPRLTGSVAAESIVVKDENLHAHLQSPEFFDSANHPEIRFESTAFRVDGDQVTVDGNLTIRGESRPVQGQGTIALLGEDPWGNQRVGLQLEAEVDRTQFGLNWNNPLPKGGLALANEVRLVVDLFLVKS